MQPIQTLAIGAAIILLLTLNFSGANGQIINTGNPYITNLDVQKLSRKNIGTQFWCAGQDNKGLMYFGNWAGTMVYNGASWQVIPVRNGSTVRSLRYSLDGKMYVGAQNDLGYLESDGAGRLSFNSMTDKLPEDQRNFGDIYRIHETSKHIIFQSLSHVLIFNQQNQTIDVIHTSNNHYFFSFVMNDELYINHLEEGLLVAKDQKMSKVKGCEIFRNKRVQTAIPYKDRWLIFTRSSGLFLYDNQGFRPFETTVDPYLKEWQIYHATRLQDSTIAIATLRNGITHLDKNGQLLNIINSYSGLRDDKTHFLYEDYEGIVWATLNDGLAKVDFRSPFSIYDERNQLKGKVHAIKRFNEKLYAGTSVGLFHMNAGKNISPPQFVPVSTINTSVWQILNVDDRLLIASTQGLYSLNKSGMIRELLGEAALVIEPSRKLPNVYYIGTLNGLRLLDLNAGMATFSDKLKNTDGVIIAVQEVDDDLWVSVRNRGLLKMEVHPESLQKGVIIAYNFEHGLSETGRYIPYNTATAGFIISTDKGFYRYDEPTDSFYPDTILGIPYVPENEETYRLVEDEFGQLWKGILNDPMAQAEKLPDGKIRWRKGPFEILPQGRIKSIYRESEDLVWFGSDDGLIKYEVDKVGHETPGTFHTLINQMSSITNDSILLTGSIAGHHMVANSFTYKNRSIRFNYSCTSYITEDNQFQYKLIGYNNEWSKWSPENRKEFTNLEAGEYRFIVRSKNAYGVIGMPSSVSFVIDSPWYLTWWAKALWLIMPIAIFIAIYRIRVSQLNIQRRKLQKEVAVQTEKYLNKSNEIELLYYVSNKLIAEDNLDSLLNIILETAIKLFSNAEKGAIILLNEKTNLLEAKAIYGYPPEMLSKIKMKVGEGQAGIAVRQRKSFFANHLEEYAQFANEMEDIPPIKSSVQVVLEANDKILGTLSLDNMTEYNAFDDDDLRVLQKFASNASLVIERARIKQELQQGKEALEKINVEKDNLINIVAHDLRAPLNKTKGFLELVKMENELNEKQQYYLSIIDGIIHQGNQLMQDLLDAQGYGSKDQRLNLTDVEVCEFLKTWISAYEQDLANKSQTIKLNCSAEHLTVTTDQDLLQRVLDNLLTNAMKYSNSGSTIEIATTLQNDCLALSVIDEGPGISESDQKKMFQLFGKLSNRPTGGESSNGLGLAIVKRIVDRLGGKIEVHSKVGEGSEFRVLIPISKHTVNSN